MNSVTLNSIQKLQYNIGWIENFRMRHIAMAQDLKTEFDQARKIMNAIDFGPNWATTWNKNKPKRVINQMLQSIEFFERLDEFLNSKRTGMQLLLKFQQKPEDVDPMEIARHQVRHQHVLEQMEKVSGSDCEELLASLEQGLMMTDDGEKFQVKNF